jgi:hypothetical protein
MSEQPPTAPAEPTAAPSMTSTRAPLDHTNGDEAPPESDGWFRDADGRLRRADSDG